MDRFYYQKLKKRIYRAHILSLGFETGGQKEDNIYHILEEEDKKGYLNWIKPQ